MGNQEWTMQSQRQCLAHDTKRRQTKQKTQHRKLKKNTSNTDFSKTPGVNSDALEGYAVFGKMAITPCIKHPK